MSTQEANGAAEPNGNRTLPANLIERIKRNIRAATASVSRSGITARFVIASGVAILAALLLLWIADKFFFYHLSRTYVEQVAEVFGLNKHLANSLVLLTFIAAVFFSGLICSFSKRKRLAGFLGLSALLIGHSLVLWYGTRNQFFDAQGNPIKCYVLSRDGKVNYGERPGTDPITGRQCRLITAEIQERLSHYAEGKRPQRMTDRNPTFFEPRTGEPVVWYYRAKSSEIQIFDLMGFHPDTGDELMPITKDIVDEWKVQNKPSSPPPRAPKIINPDTFVFFDLVTGAPRAWYRKDSEGTYEFYDGPGFHPQTGDALKIATRDIVEDWKAHHSTPRLVDPKNHPLFDPRTGRAQVWYWRSKNGAYEFYDAPGFHPQSGSKLALVTADVIEDWKKSVQVAISPVPLPSPPVTPPAAQPSVPSIGPQLRQRTAEFLDLWYGELSAPNTDSYTLWNNIYADQVSFFGKSYSRGQVIAELQRHQARWPLEQYSIKPGSLQIQCDEQSLTCNAKGLLDFDARSAARNQRSWGVASFEYVLKFTSLTTPPKIVLEGGETKARNLEPLPFTPPFAQREDLVPAQRIDPMMLQLFGNVFRRLGR